MLYFTSDPHYFHANIIKHVNRPYSSVEEMNKTLVTNWNNTVSSSDTIYILGDLSFGKTSETINLVKSLKGNKVLILGNHDRKLDKSVKELFSIVEPYLEIKWDNHDIILFHYAMKVWNKSHHGSWQLHGHSHGTLQQDLYSRQLDVGVDCHSYTPISIKHIKAYMDTIDFKPIDHHTPLVPLKS